MLVLGHTGMLGRRVMERFPDADTTDERYEGSLLEVVEAMRPDWIINCIGVTEGDLWGINVVLPHKLRRIARLIQPSTDHLWDDTEYARSKRAGEVGDVIRCAIVDPDGGMLARARAGSTAGETRREWNGITARRWADIAAAIIDGRYRGLVIPGSPTITHYDLLQSARHVFGWPTLTLRTGLRRWKAAEPTVMLPPIETQLAEYL